MLTSKIKYSVIIPNRFEDVIQPLLGSIMKFEPKATCVIIVADNHDRSYGHNIVKASGPFIYSKSVNLGINYIPTNDIILLNDDVSLLQPNTFKTLQRIAYSDPMIGILSPLVDGGCGNIYMKSSNAHLWNDIDIYYPNGLRGPDRVTFACVYIKRALLNDIGLLDENFVSYGYDDADMCIRTVKAGWKLAITNKLTVRHGTGGDKFVRGKNWNSSFNRTKCKGSTPNLNYLKSKHTDLFQPAN